MMDGGIYDGVSKSIYSWPSSPPQLDNSNSYSRQRVIMPGKQSVRPLQKVFAASAVCAAAVSITDFMF